MKRTTIRNAASNGSDTHVAVAPRQLSKSGRISLRAVAMLAVSGSMAALAFTWAFLHPGTLLPEAGQVSKKRPDQTSQVQKCPLGMADARLAIFSQLATIGMDAGRYELDARHAPSVTLQGTACEIAGEISLLNNPEGARPYYAIVRQSGPMTTLLLLRVDGEVVYTRAAP